MVMEVPMTDDIAALRAELESRAKRMAFLYRAQNGGSEPPPAHEASLMLRAAAALDAEKARVDRAEAHADELAAASERLSRPIDMQDVRLHVGEGKLSNADVLAGVNAELHSRKSSVASASLATHDAEIRRQWRLRDEFRKHWHDFCGCDPFDGSDTFPERMEAAGFIELQPATRDDWEQPFAEELGIVPGGMVWRTTTLGDAALQQDSKVSSGARDDT